MLTFKRAACGCPLFFSPFNLKGPPPAPLCVLLIVTGLFSQSWQSRNMIHQMTSEQSNPLFITQLSFHVGKVLGAKKSNLKESGRHKLGRIWSSRWSVQRALFWPTLEFKVETFDNSGFSGEETLISAPAVPHRGCFTGNLVYTFIKSLQQGGYMPVVRCFSSLMC